MKFYIITAAMIIMTNIAISAEKIDPGEYPFTEYRNETRKTIQINGSEYKAEIRKAYLSESKSEKGWRETVKELSIRGPDNSILLEKNYESEIIKGHGFNRIHNVNIIKTEIGKDSVIAVRDSVIPRTDNTGNTLQYFVLEKKELKPITPILSGDGFFSEISLNSNNEFSFQVWAEYFSTEIPLKVNPSRGISFSGEEVSSAALKEMPVMTPVTSWPEEENRKYEIQLFESIESDSYNKVSVSSKKSNIKYSAAYGNIAMPNPSKSNTFKIRPDVKYIKVEIDGNEGFVKKAQFENIGLKTAR